MSIQQFLKQNGFIALIEEYLLRKKIWNINYCDLEPLGQGSSISDNNEYLSIVIAASESEAVFSKFRANRQYRKILEHVTKYIGHQYLQEIRGLSLQYKEILNKVSQIDKLGGPLRYRYSKVGRLSPTTIRYVYVHLKLIELFGNIQNLKIVEIGGGFGGQAAVSTLLSPSLDWNIYDLPQVLRLQKKFICETNAQNKVSYFSGFDVVKTHGDLLISNYALSEISRKLQLTYFANVIQNCPKGYMAWNLISEKEGDGLSVCEVLGLIPNSVAIEEYPLTNKGNKIIAWGILP